MHIQHFRVGQRVRPAAGLERRAGGIDRLGDIPRLHVGVHRPGVVFEGIDLRKNLGPLRFGICGFRPQTAVALNLGTP